MIASSTVDFMFAESVRRCPRGELTHFHENCLFVFGGRVSKSRIRHSVREKSVGRYSFGGGPRFACAKPQPLLYTVAELVKSDIEVAALRSGDNNLLIIFVFAVDVRS